ncbi:uncharacterized protein LOC132549353 [Ylistrum balloti]|uniref:uncharacterized protein LOC132549353 n=1 Tax=Ylistrum balloti TaxID=509963 RepID=UPI002905CA35|nr:uncharacterized protein LOC132549353 [Ylistrum balloti]XP_060069275.1 uncharacterized protein LOC132549353 [Ylistrum balloti]
MIRFAILLTVTCGMLTPRSSGFSVLRQEPECRPQRPTVVTDQSGQPLITCSNNSTVATLSCRVDFHCHEHLLIDLVWVGFFAQTTNHQANDEKETENRTTEINYQGYALETEPRYRSTTRRIEGEGHVLEALLEITSVTAEDYNRRFKCVVVTEYNYEAMGKTPPDIQSHLCSSTHLTPNYQYLSAKNSAGTLASIGSLFLMVLWSIELKYV